VSDNLEFRDNSELSVVVKLCSIAQLYNTHSISCHNT